MIENLIFGVSLLLLAGAAVLAIIIVLDMWRPGRKGGE